MAILIEQNESWLIGSQYFRDQLEVFKIFDCISLGMLRLSIDMYLFHRAHFCSFLFLLFISANGSILSASFLSSNVEDRVDKLHVNLACTYTTSLSASNMERVDTTKGLWYIIVSIMSKPH